MFFSMNSEWYFNSACVSRLPFRSMKDFNKDSAEFFNKKTASENKSLGWLEHNTRSMNANPPCSENRLRYFTKYVELIPDELFGRMIATRGSCSGSSKLASNESSI